MEARVQEKSLIDELTAGLSEALREEFEERAGILEFDGGMTRECAEFAAMALIHRRHALEVMGLYLIHLGEGQYAVSQSPPAMPALGTPNMFSASLAAAVRALGGMAILTAPKSEENDVSKTEES